MLRRELLNNLIKKYSFEKSHAIIQLALEDGAYENDEVKVAVTGVYAGTNTFSLEWKKLTEAESIAEDLRDRWKFFGDIEDDD